MQKYDFDRIQLLLDVIHKCRELPKLRNLHDAAMQELEAMKPAAAETEGDPNVDPTHPELKIKRRPIQGG